MPQQKINKSGEENREKIENAKQRAERKKQRTDSLGNEKLLLLEALKKAGIDPSKI